MNKLKGIKKPAKRVRLTLKQKIEIIEKSESQSIQQLVENSGAGFSTIYDILNKKTELKNVWLQSQNVDVKNKLRKAPHEAINSEVFNWFVAAKAKNLPISGPMLQQKA